MNENDRLKPLLLIVDDDPSLRLMMRTTLQAAGFETIEGDDCASGLQMVETHKPDLLLLDVLLPDGDGYQVCSRLRAQAEFRDLPIVMVTGLNDLNSINRAFQVGATDFITKPINWGVMGYRMRYLLRSAQIYRDLVRSEGKTKTLLAALPDMIFRLSSDGRYLDFQAGAQNPFIELARSYLGHSIEENLPADVAPLMRVSLNKALSGAEMQMLEFGLSVHQEAHFWEMRIGQLSANEAVAVVRNITRRRNIDSQLQLWATVFESSREAIFITDTKERILNANRAFETMTGYSATESIGKTPDFLGSGQQDAAFFAEMKLCLAERDHWQGELVNRRKSGDIYPIWMSISAVRDKNGALSHFISVASDLSDLKEQQARIDYLSNRDVLTGLPNRHHFAQQLSQAISHAQLQHQALAVLFIDLDRFQNINDSLGHALGDQLIKELGQRISRLLGNSEHLCRNGGDEFTVLLANPGPDDALLGAIENLQQILAQPVLLGGNMISIHASIGIAMYPKDGVDGDSLLRAADTALGVAKANGRNTHCFFKAEMNINALAKLSLENQLRLAMANNQLVLYYQPQVDAMSGRCIGAEALIRWISPEQGVISPIRFIPLAEETGLIVPIGDWIIEEASNELQRWADEGLPPITVAVNISAVQFAQKKFLGQMTELRNRSSSGPLLELELTESMVMRDVDETINLLAELKLLGFQLAIDDFGTGYSSLSYLRRLPIDVLKIDQSFVQAMNTDTASLAIVHTVMTLTKTLGLRSIAEGVETAAQAQQMRDLGCDILQGYYYAKPMPSLEFRAWLRANASQYQ